MIEARKTHYVDYVRNRGENVDHIVSGYCFLFLKLEFPPSKVESYYEAWSYKKKKYKKIKAYRKSF